MRFCPLYSGSSGNSCYVEAGDARILIDAGLAGSTIEKAMCAVGADIKSINAILVTHEHSDHISGVGVLSRRYHIPVYANEGTWRAMQPMIGRISPELMRVFETGRDFFIRDAGVMPFPTPHDASESVGYSVTNGGVKFTLMTDIGHMSEELYREASGSDMMLIEANHDVELLMTGSYPYPLKRRILGERGHLSNESCGRALARLYNTGVTRACLGHLSKENNFESLAMETVRGELRIAEIQDGDFQLYIAHRDRAGEMFDID